MAKSTPKAVKTATPKATPSSSAAAKASPSVSASKKRVRVVEAAASDPDLDTPGSASKKTKTKGKELASTVGKNGVERKDLKDKKLDEIESIRSKDAPKPDKGAMKASGAEKKGKGKKAAQEEQDDDEEELKLNDEAAEDGSDAEEELDFLAGFESGEDGEDSSDEEEEEEAAKNKKPFPVEQLPKVKGDSVQKKLEAKAERKKNAKTGTIYFGRIPHGFHEAEMKSYFSQFGEVTRLRLSRNKRVRQASSSLSLGRILSASFRCLQTGASKHYAFIEFQYASVAQIVQETMDNYLLSGHILVCKVIPDDQIHPKLWVGANRKFRVVPKGRQQNAKRNAPKTEAQQEAIKSRLLSREDKKRKQLAELGIEYDFAGYASKPIAKDEKDEEPVKAVKEDKKAAKKGRKSAGGDEPAKKKPRKSK
ncbi:SPOSA6832_03604 [Sporobolomyces salmonicolor]|uniref:SPOSA6832_03604-mRNA-1:cds n=1 Tax=Sporidiobolus salmonicolor TaxID=5005 RepID=A0A0D6EPX4_SPOSA|nr:SPOSA6832_03604 [Sporobolomyces salmonicolor]